MKKGQLSRGKGSDSLYYGYRLRSEDRRLFWHGERAAEKDSIREAVEEAHRFSAELNRQAEENVMDTLSPRERAILRTMGTKEPT